AGEDRQVHLWEVATRRERLHFRGHAGTVYGVAFAPDGRTLAAATEGGQTLLWDVTGLGRGPARAVKLRPGECGPRWGRGAGATPAAARAAIWNPGAAPGVLPSREKHLRPAAAAPPGRVEGWVRDLESKRFAVREQATRELEKADDLATEALRAALARGPSLDARRRIEGLLGRLNAPASPERLRLLRSVEVLENAGTPGALRLLAALAQGPPGTLLTREAKAALTRRGK